jgi:hypothetical protein
VRLCGKAGDEDVETELEALIGTAFLDWNIVPRRPLRQAGHGL